MNEKNIEINPLRTNVHPYYATVDRRACVVLS
jgi:hypothetical protein